jgi:hypothetical protein
VVSLACHLAACRVVVFRDGCHLGSMAGQHHRLATEADGQVLGEVDGPALGEVDGPALGEASASVSVVDSAVGSMQCQWLSAKALYAKSLSSKGKRGKRLELTGTQSSFCQRSIRFGPPHCCVPLPEQADTHSPLLGTGTDVKLLAQRQPRPNSKAKYLNGALGAEGDGNVQNLLVCEHAFSIVMLARIVCLRFAALLCQICVTLKLRASQQAVRGLITAEVLVLGEIGGQYNRFLTRCQQTAREQLMTMFSCCKSLALHKTKGKGVSCWLVDGRQARG